jgi:hypothetical protein
MLADIAREAPVLIIEVNVLGRRYTRHVKGRGRGRGTTLRVPPRLVEWRLRHPRAAA